MNILTQSKLARVSIACAFFSVAAGAVFVLSGPLLVGMVDEQTLVIMQILSLFAVPLFSVVGLGLGVVARVSGGADRLATVAIAFNAALLVAQAAGGALVTVTHVESTQHIEIPTVVIQ